MSERKRKEIVAGELMTIRLWKDSTSIARELNASPNPNEEVNKILETYYNGGGVKPEVPASPSAFDVRAFTSQILENLEPGLREIISTMLKEYKANGGPGEPEPKHIQSASSAVGVGTAAAAFQITDVQSGAAPSLARKEHANVTATPIAQRPQPEPEKPKPAEEPIYAAAEEMVASDGEDNFEDDDDALLDRLALG